MNGSTNGVLDDDEREVLRRHIASHMRQRPVTTRARYLVFRIGERLREIGERLQRWAE